MSAAPLARSLSKKKFNKTFTWTKTAQVEQENWFYAVGLLISVFKKICCFKEPLVCLWSFQVLMR